MTRPDPVIDCPNPHCPDPVNPLGQLVCRSCETRLVYRYLWATGAVAESFASGERVADRYYVVSPQVWLDTQPARSPDVPDWLPDEITPYLKLFPHRLHIPEVYGFCSSRPEVPMADVLLLENVPVDSKGQFCPSLAEAWHDAPPARQVYWLWQILQLWSPLYRLGVASSLLVVDNLRVEGWRVRLKELFRDGGTVEEVVKAAVPEPTESFEDETDTTIGFAQTPPPPSLLLLPKRFTHPPTLQALADSWFPFALGAHSSVSRHLQDLCEQLQLSDTALQPESADNPEPGVGLSSPGNVPPGIVTQLNTLLLEQAAQLPLKIQVLGLSDKGPQRSHNEDTCYPTLTDLQAPEPNSHPLPFHLSLVCDGIGGHEGGEVASQMAVQSLKLQMQALLKEIDEQTEVLDPDLVMEQMQAAIRVANNLISAQNNAQGRESRQRMGTTLIMALQLPQKIHTRSGTTLTNAHEIYLASVGDSRAYWLSPYSCSLLNVDDDVASREVRLGRALYREALKRSDAGALTQALGTRNADFLQAVVQRFMVEEDGILLLCSDGLSDNGWVEQRWAEFAQPVLKGVLPLEWAVQSLVNLANEKNGYDNTSVVMVRCQVSPDRPQPLTLAEPATPTRPLEDLSEASRALLYDAEEEPDTVPDVAPSPPSRRRKVALLILLVVLLLGGTAAAGIWWQYYGPGAVQERPVPGK
ncbi:MAG: protein phosphatase 2C domain-containing protein [Leptolyngbyaceae cyanobacterium bins.59]|nr:protein phosphatase 2C domain-containing protein [Leptolyngbyaceae cyanobacterium bins.59]